MNKVMETLFEIEDKANNIIDKVAVEKREMEQNLNRKMSEFEQKVMTDTETRITDMKQQMEREMEPQKQKIYKKASEYLKAYEDKFRNDKEEIIDGIVKRITQM